MPGRTRKAGAGPRYQPPPAKRRKHGAVGPRATMQPDEDGKPVGRCAGTIDDETAQQLLETAIRWGGRRRRKQWPEKLFNVFEGIPYCGHGPGDGIFWGFPIGGRDIPLEIMEDLRSRAEDEGHLEAFDAWLETQRGADV